MVSVTFSADCIAIFFGTSSPSTMCDAVMTAKARVKETVCPTASPSPKLRHIGIIHVATIGSPTQPRPREVKVIPSCVTDRDTSICSTRLLAYSACLFPC